MVDYTVIVNGLNISDDIERDSYTTHVIPVWSDRVTTMDGVDHVVKIRDKGSIEFALNPKTADRTREICEALLSQPVTVSYFSLQKNVQLTAKMTTDSFTADYLSRCLFRQQRWNKLGKIVLTEL